MKVLGVIIGTVMICVFLLMCVDLEIARRDYINGIYPVEGCIWKFNCDRFNKMDEQYLTETEKGEE